MLSVDKVLLKGCWQSVWLGGSHRKRITVCSCNGLTPRSNKPVALWTILDICNTFINPSYTNECGRVHKFCSNCVIKGTLRLEHFEWITTCFPAVCWSTFVQSALHYADVIIIEMASQITSPTVVYSTVYSDADQRKHQSSASLAFVWGIHRDRWIPRTKGQLRRKCLHLMTSSWNNRWAVRLA